MKNKIICFFFGHNIDQESYNNNVLYCVRYKDHRSYYAPEIKDWTDLQFYGILGYIPCKFRRWYKRFYILKILKIKPFRKEDNDDIPF